MARRTRLRLLVALALLGCGLLLTLRLPTVSARGLERALTAFFHRETTVREVRWHAWPLEVEVLDIRVAGARPGAPPFLAVARVVAAPALQPLWQRRLVLSRMRVERPRLSVHAYPEGGDDIPDFGDGSVSGRELRVRRLVIENGEVELDHRRVPLMLDLPDFRGRLNAGAAGALAGDLAFGPGQVRFGDNPPLELATAMELRLEGRQLSVAGGRLQAKRIDLTYEGELRLGARPTGEFEVKGAVDLEQLDTHVMKTGFGIRGLSRFDGRAWIEGSKLRLAGALTGEEGQFDGVAIPRYAGQVAWDDTGVHLRQLSLEALSGRGTFDVDVPPGSGSARLKAKLADADLEGALRWVFGLGPLEVGSAATGDVALSWPRGRFRELSGQIALDLQAKNDGRTPLLGRFEWSAEKGVQRVVHAELNTPESAVRLAGRIERDLATDLGLDAQTRDIATADALLLRLRRALGTPQPQRSGLSGRGEFHGRWKGSLREPVFEGRFEGEDVQYMGVNWGRAQFTGSVLSDELRLSALELRRGGAQARIEGRAGTGLLGTEDALELRASLAGWPAEDFVRALGWRVELSGPLQGDVHLTGRRSAPLGELRLASRAGRYYGVPFEDLELRALLRQGRTEVPAGQARIGSGRLSFRGSLSDDGLYDGSAEAEGVEAAELLKGIGPRWPLAGRLSGRMTLQGPLDRPRLRGELTSQRLFFGDEGLGAVRAVLTGRGDGRIALDGSCRSARVDLAVSGSVAASADAAAELRVELKDTSVDPFLRVVYPALPSVATIVASGIADLTGPLRAPDKIQGTLQVSELQLGLPDYPVRNVEPLRFRLEKNTLRVEELRLAGEGTDLRIAGAAGTTAHAPLELSIEGAADLRALSVVTRRLRGRGAARLEMKVKGEVATPQVDGELRLSGAGLRLRGFPAGLDALQGTVRFSETEAELRDVTGSLGGGTVELSGNAGYAQGRLSAVDIKLEGRRVTLPYPDGLRSVLDLDLRLFGDAARQWLSGVIDVRHAVWTRRYDLATELLAASNPRLEPDSLGGALRFDVKVRAPGTLELENNLASLRASAELDITGSAGQPAVLGRAEIERGRVYFQGNTYTIRRGTIDFLNPRRIDPSFNIEAEANVRSYRVTLNVNGTLQRVYPTLTSDPPLSTIQIVNLLAGADDSQLGSFTLSQAEQQRLAGLGAATVAVGGLSEVVGLERQAQKIGLSRFSIDPALVRGEYTNATARLTVGKRVTPDLNVLYSIDLKTGKDQLISAEYSLSDRFSVLLTSSEQGGLGVDVRVRQLR